jgi:biotin/methionine sulfoxide reductase|tara:strand:- start:330 stop:506 length:177 start_codon:yes stop_codon:yes gene_type:complete
MSDYISTHWGTYKFSKDKDKKIKLDNWEFDTSPTQFRLGLAEAALAMKLEKKFKQKKV